MYNAHYRALILFADGTETLAQIAHFHETLSTDGTKVTPIVVRDPEQPHLVDPAIQTIVVDSFAAAVRQSPHNQLLIVDSGFRLEPNQWRWLNSRCQPGETHSVSYLPPKQPAIKALLFWLCLFITRVLLRINKSNITPGLTFVQRDAELQRRVKVIETSTAHWSTATVSPSFVVTQLLALTRLDGQPVQELRLQPLARLQPANLLTRRTIRRSIKQTIRIWWNQIMFGGQFAPPISRQRMTRQDCKIRSVAKRLAIPLLLMAACFALFRKLDYPLFEPDECRNAQLAMTMLETGNWFAPQLNGEPYWDKPPLQAWITTLSYRSLGQSEFATRLPTAIASLLTILLTLGLGQKLVGFRAACLGAFLLTICGGFIAMGRYVTLDAMLTLWTTGALLCGFRALQKQRLRTNYWIASSILVGLGVLTKGPVALVICLPPLFAYAWLQQHKALTSRTAWLRFVVPLLVIAAPWFIATAITNPDYAGYYVWKQHVLRYSQAFVHRQPIWYYLPAVFVMMFPASYLLPSMVRFLTARRHHIRGCRTPEIGFLGLVTLWIFAFFSLSDSKLPTYIVPAFPFVCLIMGAMLDQKVFHPAMQFPQRKNLLSRIPRYATVGLMTLIAMVSVLIMVKFPAARASNAAMFVSLAMLLGLCSLSAKRRSNLILSWASVGAIAWFLMVLGLDRVTPQIAIQRSSMVSAATLQKSRDNAETPVVFFGRDAHAASLYLNPETVHHFDEKNLVGANRFLRRNPDAIVLSSEHHLANLNARQKENNEVELVFEAIPAGRHLYQVVSAKPGSESAARTANNLINDRQKASSVR